MADTEQHYVFPQVNTNNKYPKVRKGRKENLSKTEVIEGQLLATTDTREVFMDIEQTRVQLMTSAGFNDANSAGKLLGWDGEKIVLLDASQYIRKDDSTDFCKCIVNQVFGGVVGGGGTETFFDIFTGKNYTNEDYVPDVPSLYRDVNCVLLYVSSSSTAEFASVNQFKVYLITNDMTSGVWKTLTLASSTTASDGSYRFSVRYRATGIPYLRVSKNGMLHFNTWIMSRGHFAFNKELGLN